MGLPPVIQRQREVWVQPRLLKTAMGHASGNIFYALWVEGLLIIADCRLL